MSPGPFKSAAEARAAIPPVMGTAFAQEMNAVRCPTLVLRGERSPALSQQAAERMVASKQNAVLKVIPGASHFIPIEAPTLFETAARQWLGV